MTQKTLSKDGLATPAQNALGIVGNNIRIARKRRGWTLEDMANSMLVTRKTLSRLEAGDQSVGLSVLAAALHALGMVDDLRGIASPENDAVGKFAEKQRLPERVRKKQISKSDLDF